MKARCRRKNPARAPRHATRCRGDHGHEPGVRARSTPLRRSTDRGGTRWAWWLFSEMPGEVVARHRAVQIAEGARLADLARRVGETGHRRTIQRSRETDAAYARRRELGDA